MNSCLKTEIKMILIDLIKKLIYYAESSETGRAGWPGTYWLKVTFLSKRDDRSKFEYISIINSIHNKPKLLDELLNTDLYASKNILTEFRNLLAKNNNITAIIRSVDYVLAFINNIMIDIENYKI